MELKFCFVAGGSEELLLRWCQSPAKARPRDAPRLSLWKIWPLFGWTNQPAGAGCSSLLELSQSAAAEAG